MNISPSRPLLWSQASAPMLPPELTPSAAPVTSAAASSLIVGTPKDLIIDASRLHECPVSGPEFDRMVAGTKGKHLFQCSTTVDASGIPFVLISAPDPAFPKLAAKLHILRTYAMCGSTPYGNLFMLSVRVGKKDVAAHALIPAEAVVCQNASATGKIAFGLQYAGKASMFFMADFSVDVRGHLALKDALARPLPPEFKFHHFDLAYWWLMGNPYTPWKKIIADRPQDTLSIRWAHWTNNRIQALATDYSDLHEQFSRHIDQETWLSEAFRQSYPHCSRLLDAIAAAEPLETILTLAGRSLDSPDVADDLLHGVVKAEESGQIEPAVIAMLRPILGVSWFSHSAVRCGTRRPWFDKRGPVFIPKFIDIDAAMIGKRAVNYWRDLNLEWPINQGLYLSGTDIPADTFKVMDAAERAFHDGRSMEEALPFVQGLLAEAKAHRQWTVPWGARIQLAAGPFAYVEIYEVGTTYYCVLRDLECRYVLAEVDLASCTVVMRELADSAPEGAAGKALPLLMTIVASAVRDFVVVEDRERVFSVREAHSPVGGKRQRQASATRPLYLPRVRYTGARIAEARTLFSGFKPPKAHDVSGHFRRVSRASAEQIVLAHVHGFDNIPEGTTFVRPHRRGGQRDDIVQREYRSRSVQHLVFQADESRKKTSVEWFTFERDSLVFLQESGLKVARKQSIPCLESGGFYIYAFNERTNEMWLIRGEWRHTGQKVDVSAVRELAGELHLYPPGTKGMLLTTGLFSPEAETEARRHQVALIDGTKLRAQGPGQISKGNDAPVLLRPLSN